MHRSTEEKVRTSIRKVARAQMVLKFVYSESENHEPGSAVNEIVKMTEEAVEAVIEREVRNILQLIERKKGNED